jgi:hypothetical protein
MPWIDFEVTLLLRDATCTPEVKLWIDLDRGGGLCSETALPLQRHGTCWHAGFAASNTDPGPFLYRVGIVAHPGAHFWLSMRQADHGHALLNDGDVLHATKSVLVGSWSVVTACSERLARGSLVLLRGGADSGRRLHR